MCAREHQAAQEQAIRDAEAAERARQAEAARLQRVSEHTTTHALARSLSLSLSLSLSSLFSVQFPTLTLCAGDGRG